jgi:hypothetical protein
MSLLAILKNTVPIFDEMSPDDKERFTSMCGILAAAIIEGRKIVWMLDVDTRVTMMAINCNDFEAAELVSETYHALNCSIMEDAPPKEEMN